MMMRDPNVDPPHRAQGALMVCAILNMVLGAWGLFGGFCSLISLALQHSGALPAPPPPPQPPLMYAHMGLEFLVACALLTSGVLLYRLSEGARRIAIGAGITKILSWLASVGMMFAYGLPMMKKMFTGPGAPPNADAIIIGSIIFTLLVGALFNLAYPIAMMLLITRENATRQLYPAPLEDICEDPEGSA